MDVETIAVGRPRTLEWKGERVTTSIRGLDEPDVCIGDVYRVGSAELEANTPRLPCFKLGIRFGDPGMVKRFLRAGRWGVYFRVVTEGEITVGDPVERIHRDRARIPVYEVARVHAIDRDDGEAARRLAEHERLDPSWRARFRKRAAGAPGPS